MKKIILLVSINMLFWNVSRAQTLTTPVIESATNITSVSFQANWQQIAGSDIFYELYVEDDSGNALMNFDPRSTTGGGYLVIGAEISSCGSFQYRVRARDNSGGFSDYSAWQSVTTSTEIPQLVENSFTANIGDEILLEVADADEGINYDWYDESDEPAGSGESLPITVSANESYFVEAVCGGTSSTRAEVTITINGGSAMNWIETISYDDKGEAGKSRNYFDQQGRLDQSVYLNRTENKAIFSTQGYDDLNRPYLQSLSAPSTDESLEYNSNFLSAVAQPGNLKWYYSDANSWEEKVDISTFPYIESVYYNDGTGEVKTSVPPMEAYQGQSNVVRLVHSKIFPVLGELDLEETEVPGKGEYYQLIKNRLLNLTGENLGDLTKQIVRSGDGQDAIAFVDQEGNALISAVGFVDPSDGGVSFPLRTSYSGGLSWVDIHVPKGTTITVSDEFDGGLTNLITSEDEGPSISDGFYRYATSNALDFSFTYYNASFNFYDELGRLVVSVPPKGVENILAQTRSDIENGNYDVRDIPYATYFRYDFQGRLLETEEPDAEGISQYIYRRDGSIRFSQNALQRANELVGNGRGYFSYTNYDRLGRPVEFGEYVGTQYTFSSPELREEAILESTEDGGGIITSPSYRNDWVRTYYDLPDPTQGSGATGDCEEYDTPINGGTDILEGTACVVLLPGFEYRTASANDELTVRAENLGPCPCIDFSIEQNFTFGAVSYVENEHSRAWYSYDDQGRIKDMHIWYKDLLSEPKTVSYEYDFLGNVTHVNYQDKMGANDAFYHAYTYDADRRLFRVYAGTNKAMVTSHHASTLQSEYQYYMHGSLKRIVMGNNLQGIDYVYNLNGQLKAINDPDNLVDENGSTDAFAQLFQYFSGDYNRPGVISSEAPANAHFDGKIAGVKWNTLLDSGDEQVGNYQYIYDDRNYLSGANFLGGATDAYQVNGLTYDPNGNIGSLTRNDANGAPLDQFSTYNYFAGTNQLENIPGYASWEYDEIGQMDRQILTSDGSEIKPVYDASGRVVEILDGNDEKLVTYQYDERGFRILKIDHQSNDEETLYLRNASGQLMAVYKSESGYQAKEFPVYGSNRLGNYFTNTSRTLYEIKDHLGSIRALVEENNTMDVTYTADYYPFGSLMPGRSRGDSPGRFGYQGDFAEQDPETELNYFELRNYDSKIGRWLVPDPYRQFYSPYIGMGNDPINLTDPDGGFANPCPDCPDFYGDADLGILGSDLSSTVFASGHVLTSEGLFEDFSDQRLFTFEEFFGPSPFNTRPIGLMRFWSDVGEGLERWDNRTNGIERMAHTTKTITGASAVENGKILLTGYDDLGNQHVGPLDRVFFPAIDVVSTALPPFKEALLYYQGIRAVDAVHDVGELMQRADQFSDGVEVLEIWGLIEPRKTVPLGHINIFAGGL